MIERENNNLFIESTLQGTERCDELHITPHIDTPLKAFRALVRHCIFSCADIATIELLLPSTNLDLTHGNYDHICGLELKQARKMSDNDLGARIEGMAIQMKLAKEIIIYRHVPVNSPKYNHEQEVEKLRDMKVLWQRQNGN